MDNFFRIWNKVKKMKYVSFDIFDTLIKRNVSHPHDVFYIVEHIYNQGGIEDIKDFPQRRLEAERICRKKSMREEITLSEIYKYINYSQDVAKALMNIEIETEKKICQANYPVLEIFRECLKNGKKVILISDMYLPEKVISEILYQNGITGYVKLYLSSSIGVQKGTSNLYRYALKDMGISSKDIIHIGDGVVTDYIRAVQCGIKGVHITRKYNNLSYVSTDKIFYKNNIIWNFVNNNITKYKGNNEVFCLGYETFGPLILGFLFWIHRKIMESNAKKVYFLARDMFLFVDLYRLFFPEEVVYLEVSRKSLRRCFIKSKSDIKEVLNTLGRKSYTVKEICKILAIDIDELKALPEFADIDLEESFENVVSFSDQYDKLQKILLNKLYMQDDLTVEYLRQEGLFNSSNTVIVDIGWHGTIQNMLEGIIGHQIKGLYLGNTKRENYHNLDAEGYWFNNNNELETINKMSIVGILEVMLFPNIGTTIDYLKKDNKIVPVHRESESVRYCVIEEFQNGALRFVHDMYEFLNKGNIDLLKFIDISADICMEAYVNMSYRPMLKDAKKFGVLDYEDNKITKLAMPQKLIKYIQKPETFLADYRSCKWKIGFIKQILPFWGRPDLIDAFIKKANNR